MEKIKKNIFRSNLLPHGNVKRIENDFFNLKNPVLIMEMKDYELVKKFQKGDQSAIEALIKRHKNRIFTYILLIVKDYDVASDIFQDTFVKAITSIRNGKYAEKGVFVSWVIRIAYNLIIDYYRLQKKLNTVSTDAYEYDLLNSKDLVDGNVEDRIITDQTEIQLRNLIEKLPYTQRQVILLRYYGRLTFKEIASLTNVSINTALGRVRYALMNLKKMVEKQELAVNFNANRWL